jgi:hypothetical protein
VTAGSQAVRAGCNPTQTCWGSAAPALVHRPGIRRGPPIGGANYW